MWNSLLLNEDDQYKVFPAPNAKLAAIFLLVSLIMLLTSTVNTTFGFIVMKTDGLINTFTPVDSIVSDLLISKTVEHPLGEGYGFPDNIAFDLKVDFGSLYANTTIKTNAGNIAADENGAITVSVKPGKCAACKCNRGRYEDP